MFHYPCQDGLVSAWVVDYYHRQHQRKIKLLPVQHAHRIDTEQFANKSVLICDFTPKPHILTSILQCAKKVQILDHHVTAQKQIGSSPYAIFDMKKSGAGLTWQYFYPAQVVPPFISMVEDRDIWAWKIPRSKIFTSGLSLVTSGMDELDFPNLFILFTELIVNPKKYDYYWELGELVEKDIMAKSTKLARTHAKKTDNFILDGRSYNVCIVNCPIELTSDTGNILSEMAHIDFAVLYRYYHPEREYNISLRSSGKADVSIIAEAFGGGGHSGAAGFTTKISPIDIFCLNQPILVLPPSPKKDPANLEPQPSPNNYNNAFPPLPSLAIKSFNLYNKSSP